MMKIEMKNDSSNGQNNTERRNFSRVDLIRSIKYQNSGPTPNECFTLNISEGGLCLFLSEDLHPGMTIRTEFALPGKHPKRVKADAVVVWKNGYLTGARFIV